MSENWVAVDNTCYKYYISDKGNVYSCRSKRMLKLALTNYGYPVVSIATPGKKNRKTRVHILVANHFIPTVNGKPHINHIDGDKTNNSCDNLEWCTIKENIHHSIKIGTFKKTGYDIVPRGEAHKNSKVNTKEVMEIRALKASGHTYDYIADKFNIGRTTVCHIVSGRTWKHVI